MSPTNTTSSSSIILPLLHPHTPQVRLAQLLNGSINWPLQDAPQTTGHDEVGLDPRQLENTYVLDEKTIDSSYIIGHRPGVSQTPTTVFTCWLIFQPYVVEHSRSIYARLGARIAFFGIDARTEVSWIPSWKNMSLIIIAHSKTSQLSWNLPDHLWEIKKGTWRCKRFFKSDSALGSVARYSNCVSST